MPLRGILWQRMSLLKETDSSGFVPGDKGYRFYCDDGEKNCIRICATLLDLVSILKKKA